MFRFIAFFVLLLSLPLTLIEGRCIDFEKLSAENIKIYFSEDIEMENLQTFKNGVGCYIVVNRNLANKFIEEECLDGITFESKLSAEDILKNLNAKIVSVQDIQINKENKTIFYAFSDYFSKFLIINGKKVNLQIVCENENCLVGHPLLMGSY